MPPKSPQRVALGQAIRELRQERGLTLETLAPKADLHWTYIGGVERGSRNPSWDSIVKLARALDVPVSEIAKRAEKLGL